jgi:hypothetical protein
MGPPLKRRGLGLSKNKVFTKINKSKYISNEQILHKKAVSRLPSESLQTKVRSTLSVEAAQQNRIMILG